MIILRNISKKYHNFWAIKNINLVFNKNNVATSIIGPSGSGKSTLIRCINNLETPTTGDLIIDDIKITDYNCKQLCFKIGMVFQQFNLFPHMNVIENITYAPCNVLNMKIQEASEKADILLKQLNITAQKFDLPSQLSIGQTQRVAICRALIMNPEILLFDEPTSALDQEMVYDITNIILKLKRKMMIIIVTHHIKFAKIVSDRIIFMQQGQVISDQNKDQFFSNPSSKRIKLFLQNTQYL